ncbi:MAG: type II secretion system protein [Planctomycetes bacterium]|nr:type II secretion system protein [Planctomycetota bacterium]
MNLSRHSGRRPGFTMLELIVAIAVLGTAMVVVAQTSFWSFRERGRNASRQLALELAANALETASALPFAGLTADWAAAQQLPDSVAESLSDGRLVVRVEDVPAFRPCRKVTAEVHWKVDRLVPESVRLTTLIGPSTLAIKGGSP